jgi:hypothetical protein
MLLDVIAHRHIEDPKLREEMVTDDFEEEVAAFEAMLAAKKPLPAVLPTPDAASDDWETIVDDNYQGVGFDAG